MEIVNRRVGGGGTEIVNDNTDLLFTRTRKWETRIKSTQEIVTGVSGVPFTRNCKRGRQWKKLEIVNGGGSFITD